MNRLPRSSPRAEGIDPGAILRLLRYYDEHQTGVHSIMILRHDRVVSEAWWYPYRPEYRNQLYSMSKSFTSVAVGFALQEGLLRLEDRLLDFFLDVLPPDAAPCGYMRELTLRDVLRMATGHVKEPSIQQAGEERWCYNFLSSYIEKKPGTHYLYNTAGTYMLSAVVQRVTGQTAEDYLRPRLFEPLGIEDFWWEKSPEGITAGGFGLELRTEDVAKFGVFLRNRGAWEGCQLLDPAWIDAATAKQIDFTEHMNIDSRQGYGYQFWRCQPENSYRAAGAFAQFCIVLPDQEMVIAVTSGAQDTQPVLTALWELLLPGVGQDEPQPSDAAVTEELRQYAAGLAMPMAQGERLTYSPFFGRVYALSDNDLGISEISFAAGEPDTVTLTVNGQRSCLPVGCGCWLDGTLDVPGLHEPRVGRPPVPVDRQVSCCGAWTGERVYELRILYNQTPFFDILSFAFDDYGFRMRHRRITGFRLIDRVSFGRPVTDGKIEHEAAFAGEFRF